MRRKTLRIPAQQLEMLNALVEIGDFPTVSEAIRTAVRDLTDKRCEKFEGRMGMK